MRVGNVKPGDRPMFGAYVVVDVFDLGLGLDHTYPITDHRFWAGMYTEPRVRVRYADTREEVLEFRSPEDQLMVLRPKYGQASTLAEADDDMCFCGHVRVDHDTEQQCALHNCWCMNFKLDE